MGGTKTKDEIIVPIALGAFRDGDQGPSKVTNDGGVGGGPLITISYKLV